MRTQRNALLLSVLAWVLAGGLAYVYGQAPNTANENPAPASPAPAVTNAPAAALAPAAPAPAASEAVRSAATATGVAAPAAVTSAQDGEVIAPPPGKMVVESSGNKDLINVAVDNETLENVVTMFTRITGANIVATATNLNGTVTVNLKDVEWKAALSSILDLHGLALVEKMPGSAVYSVLPKPPLDSQPQVIETIFLKYTTATELKPVISSMLSSTTNVTASTIIELASRNALIVKTTEPNMREVKRMIESMDIPSKQVCVEAKFLELDENASKQLGIRWDSLAQFGVKLDAGPFSHERNTERNNTSSDTRNSHDNSTKTTAANVLDGDQTTLQYLADGTPFNPTETTFIGDPPVPYTKQLPSRVVNSGGNASQNSTTESSQDHTTTDMKDFSRKIVDSQAAILTMDSFNVVLSALKKTEGVSVVSNPKLIVTSGSSDAIFNVGDREPIIKTEKTEGTQNSPGDKTVSSLDTAINTEFIKSGYIETGIQLQVVPVVKTDDMIEAQIWPRLTHVTGQKSVGSDGNSWPLISVKEIKTKFTLRSGQTVAIGGLTGTKDNKVVTKVPLLGDLPLIGKYLFSHTVDAKAQTETIIFVTLSRAEPADLKESTGIPLDAELVHKRMIQQKMRQEEFNEELKSFEKAAEAERAQKVRAGLLKTRK